MYARRKLFLLVITISILQSAKAQTPDPWVITADKVEAQGYYGVTVANGMLGVVSAPEPFRIKDVVLAGAYDQYGRGRVSNFLKSFNLLNMTLDIDGRNLYFPAYDTPAPQRAEHEAGTQYERSQLYHKFQHRR